MNKESIERFAREILGCGCEAEVFKNIEKNDAVTMPGGVEITHRILIGNRLLIYVWRGERSPGDETLCAIIEEGIKERNANGYNRFRLALITGDTAGDERVEAILSDVKGRDEKVHLHYLSPAETGHIDFS